MFVSSTYLLYIAISAPAFLASLRNFLSHQSMYSRARAWVTFSPMAPPFVWSLIVLLNVYVWFSIHARVINSKHFAIIILSSCLCGDLWGFLNTLFSPGVSPCSVCLTSAVDMPGGLPLLCFRSCITSSRPISAIFSGVSRRARYLHASSQFTPCISSLLSR